MLAVKPDEVCQRDAPPPREDAAALLEQDDLLGSAESDRLDEPAVVGELFGERSRNPRKRGRDEDGVVRRVLGDPGAAVADNDGRVLDAVVLELPAGHASNVLPTLDAPDLDGQAREERGLPAEAGADLEHPVGGRQLEGRDHAGDQRRLRRHLSVGDRQRPVVVGVHSEVPRDELGSRHRGDRLEQTDVFDACGARGADEIERATGLRRRRHGGAAILFLVRAWPATVEGLILEQEELARASPPRLRPTGDPAIGGCFVCFARGKTGPGEAGDPGWAGAAVVRRGRVLASAVVTGKAGAAYEPGLLALREGPLLEAAVLELAEGPDVLLVNATGRDHPRGAGLALHLGAVLELPTVGITHRLLVAAGDWPADEHGATSAFHLGGKPVGYWLRTRRGTRPLAVHAAWRTDAEAAVALVGSILGTTRTPEPLRQARQSARTARASSL